MLIATQLLPPIGWTTRRGVRREVAVAASMIAVLLVADRRGCVWTRCSAISAASGTTSGADEVVTWLQANNDWVPQHEEDISDFLRGILPAAKSAANGLLTVALGGLSFAGQIVSGAVLAFVFLLYMATGGNAI